MRHENQVAMIKRLFDHIDTGTTTMADGLYKNPVRNYSSEERLKKEQQILFRDYPLFVGLSGRLAENGCYASEMLGQVPTILVRDQQGVFRAFFNACRHRGAPVAEGCGKASRLTCPYHAWTYGLDGKLRGIPSAESFDGFDKAENGLVEFAAFEKYGMLFVVPKPKAEVVLSDIDENLAGLEDDFAAYNLDQFHHFKDATLEREMNWKICPETFMEGYHLQYLHPVSVGPLFFSNLMAFDAFGRNSRLTLPRRSLETMRDIDEADQELITHTAIIYTMFPNVTMVVQAGHIEMWRPYPDPENPGKCRVEFSLYTPKPFAGNASAEKFYQSNMNLAMRTVDDEDFVLSRKIQQGHNAEMQPELTYGLNEPALGHYAESIRTALAE